MGDGNATPDSAMRLLVIEDEALVALEIETILQTSGYEIVGIADTLADAVALATDHRPVLALVDMQLANGESGLTVAAALRDIGTASLFVTGNCPGDAGATIGIGCLHKPFNDRSLTIAVQAVRDVMAGAAPAELPGAFHIY